jgi:prepilin-type N-terminal cleavage/methylation domain-containing protein
VRRALAKRLSVAPAQAGFTLIEMLVASAMGVVLMGAVVTLIVGALHSQPGISKTAGDVQTVRFVTERLTRELREGVVVDKATASSVSFKTYVRHSTCGGSGMPPSGSPSIKCEVTYSCSGSSCTRIEAEPNVYTGTPVTIFTGLNNSSSVFAYSPNATTPTYVGLTITIPAEKGSTATTVTDGASLRNATLGN